MAHRRPSPWRLPLLLVAVVLVCELPGRADAAVPFDHYGSGNGRHNHTDVSVNSPTINRGIQHVTNTNVDGNTVTQASFCKGMFRRCRINQRAHAANRW